MEQDSIQQLNEQIEQEMKEWEVLQMHPSQIQFDQFVTDVWMKTTLDILIEKGITTQEEIDLTFKRRMLKNLKESRFRFAPQVMTNRKKQSKVTRPLKGIHLANGEFKPLD